ncbi:steroidogenic acute regulatory protein, mitochondrial-like [Bombina bombina]|uniref:steroidogenic acute regulatory protein, mitochondrial-like n=1 Tax=Bombina bombina TaxID=8345 RepID=UPI00235AC283|nr:steroidogenic acute regulatory protein, mitochondrial-like [Bombina bombina]
MLPATLKLCCGISHKHLQKLTGLQRTAVGAFGKEMSMFILNKTHSYFPNIAHSVHGTIYKSLGINRDQSRSDNFPLSSRASCYLNQAEDILHTSMATLHQKDGWQAEIHQENGDWILSKTVPRIGKVFRAEAIIDSPPEFIYTQLFEKLEEMDRWNPSISKVQILERLGRNTLLTREVTSEIPGNLISQRDFVSVRHCCRMGTSFYLVGTAAFSDLMPPQKGMIRAEAGLTCIVLRPLEGDRKKTHMTWLLSLDLKGWIPKSLTNQALSQSQADFLSHLRKHLYLSAQKM